MQPGHDGFPATGAKARRAVPPALSRRNPLSTSRGRSRLKWRVGQSLCQLGQAYPILAWLPDHISEATCDLPVNEQTGGQLRCATSTPFDLALMTVSDQLLLDPSSSLPSPHSSGGVRPHRLGLTIAHRPDAQAVKFPTEAL